MHALVGVVTYHQGVAANSGIVFSFSGWQVVGLLVSTILPIIVGLVTKAATHPGTKAILLAGLSALDGLGSQALAAHSNHADYDLGQGILLAFTAFIVGVAMHYGLWRPTTVAARAAAVGSK